MQTITTTSKLIFRLTLSEARQRSYLVAIFAMLVLLTWLHYYAIFPSSSLPDHVTIFLFSFASFAGAFLLQILFWKNPVLFRKPWFWMLLLAAPVIFATRSYLHLPKVVLLQEQTSIQSAIQYIWRSLLLILPVIIFWFFRDRRQMGFYAGKMNFQWPIFTLMLVCMSPLVLLACFQQEFATVYPKAVTAAQLDTNSGLLKWMIFELAYAFDFFSIELFFRGFLLIAFVRYVGPMAIVPSACFYCCIHFNKPMAEAISSFFGGLLLGTLSYYSRNIWTGLAIHLAMAWLMELASFYICHM